MLSNGSRITSTRDDLDGTRLERCLDERESDTAVCACDQNAGVGERLEWGIHGATMPNNNYKTIGRTAGNGSRATARAMTSSMSSARIWSSTLSIIAGVMGPE